MKQRLLMYLTFAQLLDILTRMEAPMVASADGHLLPPECHMLRMEGEGRVNSVEQRGDVVSVHYAGQTGCLLGLSFHKSKPRMWSLYRLSREDACG
jgi:hypothetical protein